jgi:amidase
MSDIHYLNLVGVSEKIRRRELSAQEVTQALLDRIEALDGGLHSYFTVLADRALQQAQTADAELEKGIWRGPLHGVPLGLKDLCQTTFAPTSAGTKIHRGFVPKYNATIVDRLELAGAVTLGKLAMTEGAYTSHHPENAVPVNPWNADYWVGSSSSGSGVATCAGLCFGSIGSDTGGSIRFPSATCGLTGMKPTWGRVSRHGVFALADSLDHIGPMTRSAADAAAMLGIMAGIDPNDPTTLTDPVPDYLGSLTGSLRGIVIGIDRSYMHEGIDPQIVTALKQAEAALVSLGARLREVRFPAYERLVTMWIPMCSIETAAAHKETYPARKSEYGPELAGLIEQGHATTGLEIADIHHERLKFNGALKAMFEDCDMLLVPTMPMPVPDLRKMGEYGEDPTILNSILRFTAPFDFSGSPTLTLPMGLDKAGMPLSMQFVGRHVAEELLLRAGHAYQSVTDWHAMHPLP